MSDACLLQEILEGLRQTRSFDGYVSFCLQFDLPEVDLAWSKTVVLKGAVHK